MLKGIPNNISSELLKALADMGHGDTIVVADHFYPAVSRGRGGVTIQAKGNSLPEMVESILKLIPLDSEYEEFPVKLMKPDPGSEGMLTGRPQVWDDVIAAVKRQEPQAGVGFIGRSDFYTAAAGAYVTVSTSEEQAYGCVILQKGVK